MKHKTAGHRSKVHPPGAKEMPGDVDMSTFCPRLVDSEDWPTIRMAINCGAVNHNAKGYAICEED